MKKLLLYNVVHKYYKFIEKFQLISKVVNLQKSIISLTL